jgi:hypothetical protein
MKAGYVAGAILGMVLLTQAAFAGRAFYVSTQGNDSWSGTLVSPWRTLGKANATLVAGDTVYVRGGEYTGTIAPANSGSAGAPIVYTKYQHEVVTLLGESKAKKGVVAIGWDLSSNSQGPAKSYIIVDGFIIRYVFASQLPDAPVFSNRFGYVCIANGNSRFNVIRNCVIMQDGDALDNFTSNYRQIGILVMDALDTRIENNDMTGMWIGILMAGGPPRRNLIRGNYIHDIGSSAIDNGDPENGEGGVQGNIIEYNVLSGSVNEDGIQFEPNYDGPTSTSLTNTGTIVRYNIVRNCAENAFDLKGASNLVFEGNVVYGNTGDNDGVVDGYDRTGGMGGLMHGAQTLSRDVIVRNNVLYDNNGGMLLEQGYKIYNNTIVSNNRDYSGPNSSFFAPPGPGFTGMLSYGDSAIVIKNNIICQQAQGEVSLNPYAMKGAAIDGNMYSNSSSVVFCDAGGGSFTRYNYADWRSRLAAAGVSGAEAHGLVASPSFRSVPLRPTSATTGLDFRLSSGSSAIDAGTALTYTTNSGSGQSIRVGDAGLFFDGFGATTGDTIVVGNAGWAVVTGVNRTTSTLQIDRSLSWTSGAAVNRPFHGNAPDIGAMEYLGEVEGSLDAPVAVYPTSSDEVGASTMIHWSRVAGAVSYHLKVSTSSSFNTVVFEREIVCDTLAWMPSLEASTEYYWSVIAIAPQMQGSWSSPMGFVTAGGVLTSPGKTEALNYVANGSFESGSSTWNFASNGTADFSLVSHDGGSAAQIAVTNPGTNLQLNQPGITIKTGTKYILRFSAQCNTGSDVCVSIQKNTTPFTCYGLWSTSVDLVSGWKQYALAFTAANISPDSVTDARLLFWFTGNAQPGDVYQIDDVSLTVATDGASTPTAPAITSPTMNQTDAPLNVGIAWNGVSTAVAYEVEVATDQDFANMVDIRVASDCSTVMGPLDLGTTYYLRIRSIGADGAGSYSAIHLFSTTSQTAVEDGDGQVVKAFALAQNYPNPFNPTTRIRYNVPQRAFVTVRVYDVRGAQVAIADEGEREAGVHEVTFDASRLSSGVYFLRMASGSFVETRKMVLMK